MIRKLTSEEIQQHIEFYHSIFCDGLKNDPDGARAFIRQVSFMTPQEILESNDLVFAPDNSYRLELRALLEKYPEAETIAEIKVIQHYEQWKQNPTSERHE